MISSHTFGASPTLVVFWCWETACPCYLTRDSSTPDSQLLSKQSPFHRDYLSWDASSNLTHQMNVSVQLCISRLDGRGQIIQKGCVLMLHEELKGWCLLSPAQSRQQLARFCEYPCTLWEMTKQSKQTKSPNKAHKKLELARRISSMWR